MCSKSLFSGNALLEHRIGKSLMQPLMIPFFDAA